ncbi:hypothetical protein GCM10011363_46490 [Marivita lacus]|uniref:Uncharacterized protein n=1 Tax=Marivita lacus TaxID=1323742 RepID=A0ABQ1LHJ9_9RHOB|nr:hypothetical protein [Marivita lacus]GGC24745.1 hypothetical protein GCM10011363_46490 [Marivita lacus]
MKVYKAGEKSKAVCQDCRALVSTTFAYRDVPFDDGTGVVKDVLASVCDQCERVVALPAQSTPAVQRARETADVPLEVMLSVPDMDLLDLAAWRIDPASGVRLRKPLLAYYIQRLAGDPVAVARLQTKAGMRVAKSPKSMKIPKRRLSVKFAPKTDASIRALMKASGLNKSRLIRGIVHEIEDDLIRPDQPKDLQKLREIAMVVAA